MSDQIGAAVPHRHEFTGEGWIKSCLCGASWKPAEGERPADPGPVPEPAAPSEFYSDEARLLYVIATDHAALLSACLSVLRECRGILQDMADRGQVPGGRPADD